MLKRKSKTQKGITLIALIITIVVLLILAVVTINSIQNDGILGHAQNAAETYNQAVKNEQDALGKYEEFLNKYNGGTTTYKEYKIGDVVTIGSESFRVIEASDESKDKVLLLAFYSIDTTEYVQTERGYDMPTFSEESYWGGGTSPYDIVEPETIPPSHQAAYAAYKYGEKLGGTGRLLTYSEAMTLKGIDGDPAGVGGINDYYWLGTAVSASKVFGIIGRWDVFRVWLFRICWYRCSTSYRNLKI